jgi:Astacin (Peptidase family M12A)
MKKGFLAVIIGLLGFLVFVACSVAIQEPAVANTASFVTTGSTGAPLTILGFQEKSQFIERKLASGDVLKYRNINGYAVINDDEIVGKHADLQKKADDFDNDFIKSGGHPQIVGKGVVIQQYCTWWIAYSWWCGNTANWNNNRWSSPKSIPVYFDPAWSAAEQQTIKNVLINGWNTSAKVGFVFVTSPANPGITVYRQPAGGACNSNVGMVGGNQPINLSVAGVGADGKTYLGCVNNRDVSHEFGHALGMFHEQQRCDRDTYVWINGSYVSDTVNWGTGSCPNPSRWMATSYDYKSVMEYDSVYVQPTGGTPFWSILKNGGGLINTTVSSSGTRTYDLPRLPSPGDFATMQAFY